MKWAIWYAWKIPEALGKKYEFIDLVSSSPTTETTCWISFLVTFPHVLSSLLFIACKMNLFDVNIRDWNQKYFELPKVRSRIEFFFQKRAFCSPWSQKSEEQKRPSCFEKPLQIGMINCPKLSVELPTTGGSAHYFRPCQIYLYIIHLKWTQFRMCRMMRGGANRQHS